VALTTPFATAADLAAGWRPLSSGELARAATLLARASQMILDEDRRGVLASLTSPTPTLVRVTCDVVKRSMSVPVEAQAVTQLGITTGPFSEQRSFANPTGDLYLTKAERRQLGFGRAQAGGSDMWEHE